jgi:hypothetical protein
MISFCGYAETGVGGSFSLEQSQCVVAIAVSGLALHVLQISA